MNRFVVPDQFFGLYFLIFLELYKNALSPHFSDKSDQI